jgi:antitoxin component of MazEF toxin-antitoxin module
MQVKTFPGTVENGLVRFAADVRLPENTRVYVVVPDYEETETETERKFDLAEMVSRMPPDYEASEEDFGVPVGKEEW